MKKFEGGMKPSKASRVKQNNTLKFLAVSSVYYTVGAVLFARSQRKQMLLIK
jgi:hypothetical protein